jgi:hypothetical protein
MGFVAGPIWHTTITPNQVVIKIIAQGHTGEDSLFN